MAKKKTFGTEGQEQQAGDGRMAKVIVAHKTPDNNYAYKEAVIQEDKVQDFIQENKD
ncbi:DUF4295 domain-containing protein [Fodinibius sp.]|uniref:DUF4295 domain-containing protein n=1 Tax=Fodinibius sp. TaxID=1872440 RepID=UPI002ACE9418|nr:DUF4295 domain-containing protein [Fodinibius sp.]MDZ7659416.1 DUF4295 domain-containing protein [Fodinibius sp.]